MNLRNAALAAYRALTAAKNGPTLYDICDPLLLRSDSGYIHFRKFYKKSLANVPMRIILARAGHPLLRSSDRAALSATRAHISIICPSSIAPISAAVMPPC
jgi:hypothetical protein